MMANPQALGDELSGLLSIEMRSLLRHIDESTPYADVKTMPILKQLKQMAAQSAHHAERLSDLRTRLELPERPQPFPQAAGVYHYVKVDVLLGPVIDEQRQRVAAYEQAIGHAQGDAVVVSQLQSLLDESLESLGLLERLRSSHAVASHAE